MQEFVPIALSVVLIIVAVVLLVVGVYLVLVLKEMRKTLTKFNSALDGTQAKFQAFAQPLQNIAASMTSLRTGMKVVDTFMQWLHREPKEK